MTKELELCLNGKPIKQWLDTDEAITLEDPKEIEILLDKFLGGYTDTYYINNVLCFPMFFRMKINKRIPMICIETESFDLYFKIIGYFHSEWEEYVKEKFNV